MTILPTVAVFALAGDDDSDTKKRDGLSIHVVLPEEPVTAEIRVGLAVKIRNVSDKPINLPWPKFINQFISTGSTAQNKTVLTVRHVGLALGHGKYPGGDLKPGGEMTVEVWHIFPDAGWYTFKCVLDTTGLERHNIWDIWESRVESKPISVKAKSRKDG